MKQEVNLKTEVERWWSTLCTLDKGFHQVRGASPARRFIKRVIWSYGEMRHTKSISHSGKVCLTKEKQHVLLTRILLAHVEASGCNF